MSDKEDQEKDTTIFKRSSVVERTPPPNPSNLPLTSLTDFLVLRSGSTISKINTDQTPITPTTSVDSPKDLPRPIIDIKSEPSSPEQEVFNDLNYTIEEPDLLPPVNMTEEAHKKCDEINSRIKNYVPEFSGFDSEDTSLDLNRFLDRAEWARLDTPEPDRNTFDQLVQFRLIKDAYAQTRNKTITDLESLKKELLNIYAVTESLDEIENKWNSCQQKPTESIRKFGQRLMKSLEDYKAGFEQKYKTKPDAGYQAKLNDQTIKIFKSGISNAELRKHIITIRTTDVNTLISETELIENMISEIPARNAGTPNNSYQHRYEAQRNTPSRSTFCEHCKIRGHTIQQCRSKFKNPNINIPQFSGYVNPNNINQNRNNMRYQNSTYIKSCSICRRNGHDDKECWTNRQRYSTTTQPTNQNQNNFGYQNRYTNQRTPPSSRPQERFQPPNRFQSPNKFQPSNRFQPNNTATNQPRPHASQAVSSLENEFEKMRIHSIEKTDVQPDYNCEELQYPEFSEN